MESKYGMNAIVKKFIDALESSSQEQWSTAAENDAARALIWLCRRNRGAPVSPQRMTINLSSKIFACYML
jgi:hypothetical protein